MSIMAVALGSSITGHSSRVTVFSGSMEMDIAMDSLALCFEQSVVHELDLTCFWVWRLGQDDRMDGSALGLEQDIGYGQNPR